MATAEADTSRVGRAPPGDSVYDGFISYSHAADDLLAPRLQAGLQRFAKPWWKRRALRIFRDESSLSANPHLWSSITNALDQSGWFVVLLSPDAAASEWVNQEVEYWLEHKDPARIIPVLTDGEFGWANGEVTGDAAPPALHGAFGDEPRWVDLRFARNEEQVDLNNPVFSAAVADIASPMRGVPKDELASEEVRQHRRTVRTAWSAGVVVVLLGVAAAVAAVVAVGQSNEARAQRDEAQRQTEIAQANEQRAQEQTDIAEEQTAVAQENERNARAEALAANAVAQLDPDPELSVLLAGTALDLNASPAAINAMHAALQEHRTIFQAAVPEATSNLTAVGGLSPDGTLLALAMSYTDTLDVWDVDGGDRLWQLSTADDPLKIINAGFTTDGSQLVVLLIGDLVENPQPTELRLFDAHTGELDRVIEAPDCTGSKYFPGVETPYYDLSRPMVWVRDLDCEFFVTPESELGLFDPVTGVFSPVLPIKAFGLTVIGVPTQDASGRLIAVDDAEGLDGRVVDVATGDIVYEYGGGMATLSADGTKLLARSDGEHPSIELRDIEADQVLWRAGVAGDVAPFLTRAWFNADESLVYGLGWDGSAYVLDAATGFEVLRLRGDTGISREVVMSRDGRRLATFSNDGTARVWDVGSEVLSEAAAYATFDQMRSLFPGGVDVAGGRIAVWAGGPGADGSAEWQTIVVDAATGDHELTVAGGSAALSPDGSLLAYRPFEASRDAPEGSGRIGDVRVIEAGTGQVVAELDAPCDAYHDGLQTTAAEGCSGREDHPEFTRTWRLRFSPDGDLLAMVDGADSAMTVWEVATGDVVISERIPDVAANWVAFSPDESIVLALYAPLGGDNTLSIHDLRAGTTTERSLDGAVGGFTYTPDQSLVIAADFGGGISYLDGSDLSLIERVQAHQGQVNDFDISPSGALVASTGDDGVRVWSVGDHSLQTGLGFDGKNIQFVRFLDDTHLLLVPGVGSSAIVVVLDPDELAAAGLAKVTRAFTETECLTYGIDPCPTTLEELRGG
jgi:WD40 repeat protein